MEYMFLKDILILYWQYRLDENGAVDAAPFLKITGQCTLRCRKLFFSHHRVNKLNGIETIVHIRRFYRGMNIARRY